MASSYRLFLENWLKSLDVKAENVLDVGGSQNPIKGRTKSWQVKNYKIADLDKPHEGKKPDLILDLNNNQHFNSWVEGDFDIVFCLDVFEYVYNPLNAMGLIASKLKTKGTAYITFPSFYPTHNPVADDCLRYMESGIKKLADSSHLKVEKLIRRRPETEALRVLFSVERLKAAKDYDHMFLGFIAELRKT